MVSITCLSWGGCDRYPRWAGRTLYSDAKQVGANWRWRDGFLPVFCHRSHFDPEQFTSLLARNGNAVALFGAPICSSRELLSFCSSDTFRLNRLGQVCWAGAMHLLPGAASSHPTSVHHKIYRSPFAHRHPCAVDCRSYCSTRGACNARFQESTSRRHLLRIHRKCGTC